MELVIDLSDRTAIRNTYGDCQKWRRKGGILRNAVPSDYKPFDPTRWLPQRKWQTVLELGCGMEQWIRGLVARAAPDGVICACDLSEDVLRVFSAKFSDKWPQWKSRHYCILADGEHLPFTNSLFDGISAVFVGHHMSNAEAFVYGLARTLKPDGWLLTNALDWSAPPPDFPSQGLQRLLGAPARFIVRNAFDEMSARDALHRYFGKVREKKVIIPATLRTVEELITLHSRQEEFIKRVLPPGYRWIDYIAYVKDVVKEYIAQNGYYKLELPITYFIAEQPRPGGAGA